MLTKPQLDHTLLAMGICQGKMAFRDEIFQFQCKTFQQVLLPLQVPKPRLKNMFEWFCQVSGGHSVDPRYATIVRPLADGSGRKGVCAQGRGELWLAAKRLPPSTRGCSSSKPHETWTTAWPRGYSTCSTTT